MRLFIATITLLLFGSFVYSQPKLVIKGEVWANEQEILEGAEISVYKKDDQSLINRQISSSEGFYKSKVEIDNDYTVIVRKPGFVSKKIKLLTTAYHCIENTRTFVFKFKISLFDSIPNQDYSLYQKEVATIFCDTSKCVFSLKESEEHRLHKLKLRSPQKKDSVASNSNAVTNSNTTPSNNIGETSQNPLEDLSPPSVLDPFGQAVITVNESLKENPSIENNSTTKDVTSNKQEKQQFSTTNHPSNAVESNSNKENDNLIKDPESTAEKSLVKAPVKEKNWSSSNTSLESTEEKEYKKLISEKQQAAESNRTLIEAQAKNKNVPSNQLKNIPELLQTQRKTVQLRGDLLQTEFDHNLSYIENLIESKNAKKHFLEIIAESKREIKQQTDELNKVIDE